MTACTIDSITALLNSGAALIALVAIVLLELLAIGVLVWVNSKLGLAYVALEARHRECRHELARRGRGEPPRPGRG